MDSINHCIKIDTYIGMSISHKNLNKKRSEEYRKPPEEEAFLERFNSEIQGFERNEYRDIAPRHPFLFVIGLPRSGTTLLSQLLAHCLDVGYINNLAARFWKAPVTGLKFSENVLDLDQFKGFESEYGATHQLADIHEFGYFWREWLNKDSFEHIKNARAIEDQIDWQGLRKTLANMQDHFNRPMVFKNIFGSYHIPKINQLLKQTLWIYIERDPLDTAVSILEARKKYYNNPDTWWSYVPPEYEKIIDMDYRHQIAGQIYYLKKFYMRELGSTNRSLKTTYRKLTENPSRVLKKIREKVESLYGVSIPVLQRPPEQFTYRTYDDRQKEKEQFSTILQTFEHNS